MELPCQFVKSLSHHRRKKLDIKLQWFATNRKRSRKRSLKQMDDDVEMTEAIVLCGVILGNKVRFRKKVKTKSETTTTCAFKKRLQISRDTFKFILDLSLFF